MWEGRETIQRKEKGEHVNRRSNKFGQIDCHSERAVNTEASTDGLKKETKQVGEMKKKNWK